jgi:ribonuclease HI
LRSLEYIEKLKPEEKTATVYTDSQATTDSLKKAKSKRPSLKILDGKTMELEQVACKIRICWVKAHAGIQGNEQTDKLAMDAAGDLDIAVSYNRIPKSVVKSELESRNLKE